MTETTRDENRSAVDTDAINRAAGARYARNANDTEGTSDPNDTDTARRADVTAYATKDEEAAAIKAEAKADAKEAKADAKAAKAEAKAAKAEVDRKDNEDAEAGE